MADRTTIAVTKETRDALATFGKKGESFESIVVRLLVESGWMKP